MLLGAAMTAPGLMQQCLQAVQRHPRSGAFLFPVSDSVPSYYDVVECPMDLSTLQARLSGGLYTSLPAFAADLELIFENCRLFNAPDSVVCRDVDELEQLYLVWKRKFLPAEPEA